MSDDLIDVGDLPELPEEGPDSGIKDEFGYDVAFKFAFVGIGQGGGRIAEAFHRLGYRSVCAVNTAHSDLKDLAIPEASKLDLQGGGAGKDPAIARARTEGRDEDIYDLYKRCWGDEIDYAILCLGAGGGTGAGCWPKCLEVAKRYLEETKRPTRIGVIVSLPKNGEGSRPAANTIDTLKGLVQESLSPFILVDNERINKIFPGTPPAKFWPRCNGQIASLFHLFNRIAAAESPHTSFDRQDLGKLLDSSIVSFGATPIKEYSNAADISKAVRQQLAANILASTDLTKGKQAGCIFICSQDVYESIPTEVLDHGFESLNRILAPGSTVFRGIYPGNTDDLRCYTMIGDLQLPEERITELATKAGGADIAWLK